jgi:hypothetical protein
LLHLGDANSVGGLALEERQLVEQLGLARLL